MTKVKSLPLMLAGSLFLLAAAFFLQPARQTVETDIPPLFPDLLNKANEVSRISIQSPLGKYNIVKQEAGWAIPEAADYPVDSNQIKAMLLSMVELQLVERKTANPDFYPALELESIDEESARSSRIAVKDASGKLLADLIIGKQSAYALDENLQKIFVRKTDESQSWLTVGSLPEFKAPLDWIDKRLIKLSRNEVKSVVLKHADNSTLTLIKEQQGDKDFTFPELKPDDELVSPYAINRIPYTFSELTISSVLKKTDIDFSGRAHTKAIVTTFSGLQLSFELIEVEHQPIISIIAGLDLEAAGDTITAREVTNKAEKLNALFSKWVYVIPEYQASAFKQRAQDLVKQDVKKAAEQAG